MEAWRGHFPLCPFKIGRTGRRCLFIIGVGAGKFLGCERFCPNFPRLARKVFWATSAYNFSPTKVVKASFWCNHQKKGLHGFLCKPRVPFFVVKQSWAPFSPGFSGLLARFSTNQNFWGCACNPCTPTSNTIVFHNSIIGNFMVYRDRLETNLLLLFRHPENSEWFSKISVIIFEVNIVDEQKHTQSVTIFL